VLIAPAASADGLVTNDGASIEIKGGWEIEGKAVTFSLPNGTYSSMRLSDVDLDASKALTMKAAEESAKKDELPVKRQATMVITDDDVFNPPSESGSLIVDSDEGTVTDAAPTDEVAPRVDLEITNWQERVDSATASLEITGTVQNPSSNPITSIAIDVSLFDDEGNLLTKRLARTDQPVLGPGASTGFIVLFPDVLSFASAEFEIQSRGFVNHPASAAGSVSQIDG
jgi:hypothetical protein